MYLYFTSVCNPSYNTPPLSLVRQKKRKMQGRNVKKYFLYQFREGVKNKKYKR